MSPLELHLAPSLLSADFGHLAAECARVGEAGADWLHFDVMDGHFVPNLTVGAPVLRRLRDSTELFLDVHLMIEDPDRYAGDFIDAGANLVSFHVEAVADPRPILRRIRARGCRNGLALRPGTPVEAVLPFLEECDLILVMTVEPGFGGQSFLEAPLEKIPVLHREAERRGQHLVIEVDGGIDARTLPHARAAGATAFVAGSAIFGRSDPGAAVRELIELMDSGGSRL